MSDLRELYQDTILDHNKRPRNFRVIPDADFTAEGHNPLCGDKLTLYLRLADGVVTDIAFQGSGCAISTASVSMLTECAKGKTIEETRALFRAFHALVTAEHGGPARTEDLGKLAVFSGVCEFPVRVKCATLSWHTLMAALEGANRPVSTE